MSAPAAWCSARTSKQCRADSGLATTGAAGTVETKPAPVTELRCCVSCHTYACQPCSIELSNGEWECRPCAQADVREDEAS